MKPYGNAHGNSGVIAYEIGRNAIDIQFISGEVYRYSYASAGRSKIEHMKALAEAGAGLSTYISQHVHNAYEAKLH